eukprot:c40309_g1_i1 orf=422-1198(-)
MDSELEGAIQKAANFIVSGHPIVAFTGAGISVESGIPDFRSPGGLWSKYDPSVYCNFHVFQDRPELFWTMAAEMHNSMSNAHPNPAHVAMAELEQLSLLSCIITQNVDNLHQQAGSKLVYELHGNASTSTCMSCKQKFATDELMLQLQSNKGTKAPKCRVCDGLIKMDAVLFGEALPQYILENAMGAARKAKVLLVVGTSLTVSPANFVVDLCKRSKGKVLICDPNSTNADIADVMLCGPAGEVLPRLVKACSKLLSN